MMQRKGEEPPDGANTGRSRAVSTLNPNMPPPIYGRVLRSMPGEPGKVSLKAGDTIKVLETTSEGYLIAEIAGMVGLFPAHLVEVEDTAKRKKHNRTLTRGTSSPGVTTFMNNELFGTEPERMSVAYSSSCPPLMPYDSGCDSSPSTSTLAANSPERQRSGSSRKGPPYVTPADHLSIREGVSANQELAEPEDPPNDQREGEKDRKGKRPAPDKPLLTSTTYKSVLSKSSPLLVIKPLTQGINMDHYVTSFPLTMQSGGEAGNMMTSGSIAYVGAVKVIKQGYLLKKGHKRRNWTKRWFILRADRKLRYLVSPGDKTLKGEINLSTTAEVSRAQGLKNAQAHPYCLQIVVKDPTAKSGSTTYYLDAPSPEEMILWIQALQRVIKA